MTSENKAYATCGFAYCLWDAQNEEIGRETSGPIRFAGDHTKAVWSAISRIVELINYDSELMVVSNLEYVVNELMRLPSERQAMNYRKYDKKTPLVDEDDLRNLDNLLREKRISLRSRMLDSSEKNLAKDLKKQAKSCADAPPFDAADASS